MKEKIRMRATTGGAKRKRSGGLNGWAAVIGIALVAGVEVLIYSALAVPQPMLTIGPLGSDQEKLGST